MADFYIDPSTDDVYVGPAGQTRLTATDEEETTQRLRMKLRWFLGEWFLDTTRGVPYFRDVLVKAPNLATIRSVFNAVLAGDQGVDRVQSLALQWDREQRHLDVQFQVILVSGQLLDSELGIDVLSVGSDVLTLDDGEGIAP